MAMKFQAGIGPSAASLHLYEPLDGLPRLSLCRSTVIARNYKGSVSMTNANLCGRCFRNLQGRLPEGEAITAELIGVSAIED